MTFETIAYLLVALALGVGVLALIGLALVRGPRREGPGAMIPRHAEKQVLIAVLLVGMVLLLGTAFIVREPTRMASAAERQKNEAIDKGAQTFASLCVACHGGHGEGGIGKPLNVAQFREGSEQDLAKAADLLRKTISRGRYGTAMPAWAQDDGGPLNSEQVEQLVTMIQYGDWANVADIASSAPQQSAPRAGTTGATSGNEAHPGVVDLSDEGKELYASKGCTACHGVDLAGGVGPNLQHIASKADIAGTLPVSADNLKQWLANPSAVKPGTAMPKLGLSDHEIDALSAFLLKQK